jgi:splicing factor 1
MARDCTSRRDPNGFMPNPGMGGPSAGGPNMKAFDSEYASLMAELGEGGGGGGSDQKAPWARNDIGADSKLPVGTTIPPWRRPEVWQPPSAPTPNQGYRPPQAGGYPGYQGGAAAGAGGYGGYQQGGYGTGASAWSQASYPQSSGYGDPNAYAQYYQNLNYQQQS